ncbi:MAG: dihydroxyacetone kinase subunit L [Oscillospiraceae bacterium]|nr:dihydroxyacetone kinase subunit L [Oscillospiraceae bacterium]
MDILVYEDIVSILGEISAVMAEQKAFLCELDAGMGDGDLGITMSSGWAAAAQTAKTAKETDIGKILMKSGLKMSSAAPSTMGTLLASALMEAGKSLSGKTLLGTSELSELLTGLCAGITKRGRCAPGDRTVLDSIWPAAEAAKQLGSAVSLKKAAAVIRDASKKGLENTKEMLPKFGRAAVFAEKVIGRQDQGATAGFLIIDAICNYIEKGEKT